MIAHTFVKDPGAKLQASAPVDMSNDKRKPFHEPDAASEDTGEISTDVFDSAVFAHLYGQGSPESIAKRAEPEEPTAEWDSTELARLLEEATPEGKRKPVELDLPDTLEIGPLSDDQPGKCINERYVLVEVAGRGSTATVWRAVSRGAAGFERTVALKRLSPKMAANRDFLVRFIEEARVGSRLRHPHIVQVFDFGVDVGGEYFLVLEWVNGLDFGCYLQAHRARKQAAPWPLVVAIVIEALRGLAAAHDRHDGPFVHQDVCPQNILIGFNGIAKISDFGLSRAIARGGMTHPEIPIGKLAYKAPELTRGVKASVQSDLYGIGAVLWEALSGRPIFEEKTELKMLEQVRRSDVTPLSTIRKDLPDRLTKVVHMALAKHPGQRFSEALQMVRSLSKVLRSTSTHTGERSIGASIRDASQSPRSNSKPGV